MHAPFDDSWMLFMLRYPIEDLMLIYLVQGICVIRMVECMLLDRVICPKKAWRCLHFNVCKCSCKEVSRFVQITIKEGIFNVHLLEYPVASSCNSQQCTIWSHSFKYALLDPVRCLDLGNRWKMKKRMTIIKDFRNPFLKVLILPDDVVYKKGSRYPLPHYWKAINQILICCSDLQVSDYEAVAKREIGNDL